MAKAKNTRKIQKAAENLLLQARQARREARYSAAKRSLLEAATLCQEAGIRLTLARTFAMLGQIERDQQRLDEALSYYEQALTISREIASADMVAHTVRHIGDIHRSAGRLQLAEPCYAEALSIYRNSPHTRPLDLANAIRGLAILKGEMKDLEEARQLWEEARELYLAANVAEGVAECEQRIADLDSLKD